MIINKNSVVLMVAVMLGILYACVTPNSANQGTSSQQSGSYREQHRPQFHFSPATQWMNDPNGMVFYDGEYHLFYQFYPDSNVWGPMHWAHAVSKDMVYWDHLPIAIYPDSLGYIFSGSAVVDWNNTSGFGINGKPPLVAMFTYHNVKAEKAGRSDYENQGIAYSNDRGRTWIKYSGNPALINTSNHKDFRDPKLVWDDDSKQWVVVLAVGDHTEFWGSPNLKKWRYLGEFGKELGAHGGVWECPDLFSIKVAGTGEKKWILIVNLNPGGPNGGSGTQYFVGNFDGKQFIPDPNFVQLVPKGKGMWLDWGKDNYAGVTWSDVPSKDGRRLLLGWMSNWEYAQIVPTTVWRNATTLPREMVLKQTQDGYRLYSQPARELEKLRATAFQLPATTLSEPINLTDKIGFSPAQSEWMLEFIPPVGSNARCGIELSNEKNETYRIGFDAAKNQFFSDRTNAGNHAFSDKFANNVHISPRFSKDNTVRLHVFFDAASAELFADDGATLMTELYFPSTNFSRIKIFAEGGDVSLAKCQGYLLKRIWK
jgi:fructan beta-fructosidase